MTIKSLKKTIVAALIIVLGMVVSIVGISEKFHYYGYYTYYETYGGDAYTGIQNAAADTSKNIQNLGYMCEEFFNALFLYSGLLIILLGVYFLSSNISIKRKKEHPESVVPTVEAVGVPSSDQQSCEGN